MENQKVKFRKMNAFDHLIYWSDCFMVCLALIAIGFFQFVSDAGPDWIGIAYAGAYIFFCVVAYIVNPYERV